MTSLALVPDGIPQKMSRLSSCGHGTLRLLVPARCDRPPDDPNAPSNERPGTVQGTSPAASGAGVRGQGHTFLGAGRRAIGSRLSQLPEWHFPAGKGPGCLHLLRDGLESGTCATWKMDFNLITTSRTRSRLGLTRMNPSHPHFGFQSTPPYITGDWSSGQR